MGAIGRFVAHKLVQEAPRQLHLPPESLRWARRDSAKIAQLERLFERVKAGDVDPHSATEEAVRLLQEDGDTLPPQFVADMTAAVLTIRRDWKQLEIPIEAAMAVPEDSNFPEPAPSSSADRQHTALPPRRRLHVEVYRSSKNGEELVTIVPL
jgi:hypothetical protein